MTIVVVAFLLWLFLFVVLWKSTKGYVKVAFHGYRFTKDLILKEELKAKRARKAPALTGFPAIGLAFKLIGLVCIWIAPLAIIVWVASIILPN